MWKLFILMALFWQCQTAPLPPQNIFPGQTYEPQPDDSYRIVWSAPFEGGYVVQSHRAWIVRTGQDGRIQNSLLVGRCAYGVEVPGR